jgi:hypothetical protein
VCPVWLLIIQRQITFIYQIPTFLENYVCPVWLLIIQRQITFIYQIPTFFRKLRLSSLNFDYTMTYYIHYLWKNNNPKCHSGDCWAAGSLSAPLKLCLYHEELTRISVYLLLGCVRVKPLLYNKNRQKRSHRNPDDVRSVCSLDYGWTGFSHPDKIRSGSSLNLVYMGQSISWMMRISACNGIVFEICQRPASMLPRACLNDTSASWAA